jgi:hypothetical protein
MATESQSLLMVSNFIFFLNKKNQMGKKIYLGCVWSSAS